MNPGFSSVLSLIFISDLDISNKERHPPRALIWSMFGTHEKDYKRFVGGGRWLEHSSKNGHSATYLQSDLCTLKTEFERAREVMGINWGHYYELIR